MRAISCIMLAAFGCASALGQVPYDEAKPATGVWQGLIRPGDAFCQIVIATGDDDAWSVKCTMLPVGALASVCTEVEIDGRSIGFHVPAQVPLTLAGEVSADGQQFTGTASGPADLTFEFARSLRPEDLPESMAFSGKLAGVLDTTLVLAQTPGGDWVGHLDIPQQGLQSFPVTDIVEGDAGFTAKLPVPGGASMKFTLDESRERLEGTFTQGPQNLALSFERDLDYAYRELARPQHPEPPFAYEDLEVVAPQPEGFVIAGTLTVPDPSEHGPPPYPCAVLISGSGQQDRDETIFGHKPFMVIADHLTRNGIAVMRYDDRGVGGSQVEDMSLVMEATTADFAKDTAAVVRHLRTLEEIDGTRVGLIGHSEGGMIAPMVCGMDDQIAFAILLAAPGVRGAELLAKQLSFGWALQGADDATIAELTPLLGQVLELIARNASNEEVRETIQVLLDAEDAKGLDGGVPQHARFAATMGLLDNNWMRFFLAYDPAADLAAVTCPMLAANGTLDLQVWHEQNLDAIERVMTEAGRNVTIKRYEKLNHLFQPAVTGAGTEYASIEITFDQQVLDDMSSWIGKVVDD